MQAELTTSDINVRNNSQISKQLQFNASAVIAELDAPCQDTEIKRIQLVEYCAKFDRARNADIRKSIPELTDFMNQYNYEKLRQN
jgi:hypothetical protein